MNIVVYNVTIMYYINSKTHLFIVSYKLYLFVINTFFTLVSFRLLNELYTIILPYLQKMYK